MWTVHRGVAYDLGPFLDEHPGGKCAAPASMPLAFGCDLLRGPAPLAGR